MAYSNSGGLITITATTGTALNLVDALVAAGLLTARAPLDRGQRAHYTYHSITFTVDASNTGDIFLGHSTAVTNVPSIAVTLRLPKTSAPYIQNAIDGLGTVENWFLASANGTEKVYVEILE